MDASSEVRSIVSRSHGHFGLRAFFVVVTLLAGFCGGWTACDINRERHDAEVLEHVSKKLDPVLRDLRTASDKLARQMSTNQRIESQLAALRTK